jgi:hypothetical protein
MAPGLERTSETQLPTDRGNPPMGQPSSGSVRPIGVIGQTALHQSQANTQPPEPAGVHQSGTPDGCPGTRLANELGVAAVGRKYPLRVAGSHRARSGRTAGMGGELPLCFPSAAGSSGRSADGLDWPKGDQLLSDTQQQKLPFLPSGAGTPEPFAANFARMPCQGLLHGVDQVRKAFAQP